MPSSTASFKIIICIDTEANSAFYNNFTRHSSPAAMEPYNEPPPCDTLKPGPMHCPL